MGVNYLCDGFKLILTSRTLICPAKSFQLCLAAAALLLMKTFVLWELGGLSVALSRLR